MLIGAPRKLPVMKSRSPLVLLASAGLGLLAAQLHSPVAPPKACIDGQGPGWRTLGGADFTRVNCRPDTFAFEDDGLIRCTGKPIGVIRSKKAYKNFELVAEWRHLESGGNSGFFVWTTPESIKMLAENPKQRLPHGIEVQVLDLGYKTKYERGGKRKATWFTCHGDVFAVGKSRLKPFAPLSPNGSRSFPSEERSKGVGEWNHYYVRCINGEVRLWVNGKEVSGGTAANPAQGYLCLESEGSPLEFRGLRIRELP